MVLRIFEYKSEKELSQSSCDKKEKQIAELTFTILLFYSV
jgi:hypothetical protein